MEKIKMNEYQAPQVEILEVAIESGFATSGEGNAPGFEHGGNA